MYTGWGYGIRANQFAAVIDLDVVFISEECFTILFGPIGIQIFLFEFIWFILPVFRYYAFTNLPVFFPCIALPWNLYD
jgi:hypothetical protein